MKDHITHWKDRHRSFYYLDADIPDPIVDFHKSALLIIDIQNIYLSENKSDKNLMSEADLVWAGFRERLEYQVIPNANKLVTYFRERSASVIYVRIACLTEDGRDRSLSQKRPGFNNILLPYDDPSSQIVDALKPAQGEVVLTKTTDSAVTGTNLSLILRNMGICHVIACGIFTDQCVSSTVRSLADESFDVFLMEDACTAVTEDLHYRELEIINNIYCQVMRTDEFISIVEAN